MAKLDPRLRFLARRHAQLSPHVAARLGASALPAAKRKKARGAGKARRKPTAEIMVRMRPGIDMRELEAAGMRIVTAVRGANPIATGEIPMDRLSELQGVEGTRSIEAVRMLMPELDVAVPEAGVDVLHHVPLNVRGKGAIVGLIDSGIDYRHPDFCRIDSRGRTRTRIRCLWDQGEKTVAGGKVSFGREYTRAEIDAALTRTASQARLPRRDPNQLEDGHGTHVAGVAAGGGHARATHAGFAPEADLMVVALKTPLGQSIGRSTDVMAAFDYLIRRANGTPLAINLSRGMNGGGHCGETALETALETYARLPDVAIVKSTGNEQAKKIHASGMLFPGETHRLRITVPENDRNADIVEVWFDDRDDIGIAVKPPRDQATAMVRGESEREFKTRRGDTVSIAIDRDAADTGDTVATITITPGKNRAIQAGEWHIILYAGGISTDALSGHYDAWIERGIRRTPQQTPEDEQATFVDLSNDPTRTITIPGTGRSVITVGAYVTKAAPGQPTGQLAAFSSRGPTRYGLEKPDLVAPGQVVEAAKARSGTLIAKQGTSVSAPAVTGTAALIMSEVRGLCCYQLKQIFARSARRVPLAKGGGNGWGGGKLDAGRALKLAMGVRFPVILNVRVRGTKLSWRTDIPTTGEVRFSIDRRYVQLLKKPLLVARSTRPTRSHSVDLRNRPAATYFCEIVAYEGRQFFSEDDNGGVCYEVQVPTRRTGRRPGA